MNIKRIALVAVSLFLIYVVVVTFGQDLYRDYQYSQQAAQFQHQCDEENSAVDCAFIGVIYIEGRGVDVDVERGRDYLRKSCDMGVLDACTDLGWYYENPPDDGWGEDAAKAASYYDRACEHDLATACANLARMARHGTGVDENWRRAVDLYDRACEADHPDECIFAGRMLLRHQESPDIDRVVDLYERGCEAKDANCLELAILHWEGEYIPRDEEKSSKLFERACEGGNSAIDCD